jgi:hypothetical protein
MMRFAITFRVLDLAVRPERDRFVAPVELSRARIIRPRPDRGREFFKSQVAGREGAGIDLDPKWPLSLRRC